MNHTSLATPPLLQDWTGPYGGVPPFTEVSVAQFIPALEAAMAEHLLEIDAIATNPAMPTFANTLAAMEAAGRTLDRVLAIYDIYSGSMSDTAMQEVERDMEPKLAAFHDVITQNAALFARVAAVYDQREHSGLTPEQQRLTWVQYQNFARAGAQLGAVAKTRLSAINQALAALFTDFSQRILKDESDTFVVLNEADLAGLPESERAAAAAEAGERKLKGKWVIANTRSSVEPFLTYSTRRDLRERVWRNFVMRGDNGSATDTKHLNSRHSQTARRTRQATRLCHACALAVGRFHGQDACACNQTVACAVASSSHARP